MTGAGVVSYVGLRLLRRWGGSSLRGEVVLITGGSRGLGLCLAHEFARAGCKLVLCAREERELAEAARDLGSRGAEVLTLPCDVADRGQVEQLVERVLTHFGRIDILVNNASILQVGPLETMTYEDFQRAMQVHFWGSVHTTLAVLPEMRRRRHGRIVNITSIGGKVAVPHLLPHDCAKFALVGFSEGLRAELARESIRVTTIVPGLMRTGSPVNVVFKGQPEREYGWFTLGDVLPLTSMDARRAARRIVQAARRGEAEVVLSWQARVLRLVHDLLPGLTTDLLGLANRFLPGPGATAREARGMDVAAAAPWTSRMVSRYARNFNQYAGRPST